MHRKAGDGLQGAPVLPLDVGLPPDEAHVLDGGRPLLRALRGGGVGRVGQGRGRRREVSAGGQVDMDGSLNRTDIDV